eukprot:4213794-Prymnesium_polylepis.1
MRRAAEVYPAPLSDAACIGGRATDGGLCGRPQMAGVAGVGSDLLAPFGRLLRPGRRRWGMRRARGG